MPPSETPSAARQTAGAALTDLGRRRGRLALLTLALATDAMGVSVLSTLFPAIMTDLGLVAGDLGVLTAANKVAGAVCSPLWVWLARRWTRKGVLVVTAGLWGAWGIAAGFSDGYRALLVLSCVLAAGYAGAPPVVTAMVSDLVEDAARGRAVGTMYGMIALAGGLAGPLLGQLANVTRGWRLGFWAVGAMSMAAGVLILLLFRDPASRPGAPEGHEPPRRPAWAAAAGVFRVPSFNVMLLSRLLSGHLVLNTFGILFLTNVRHFSNGVAALVLFPFIVGYLLGAFGGAVLADWMHVTRPRTGRVLFLQLAQFAFAGAAYGATQFAWGSIEIYMAWWLSMGLFQGVNPGVNRPIVMAVIAPELRVWAFTVMIAITEPIGWAAYSLGVGWFGDQDGLRMAFLAVLVVVMVLNGLAITPLYRTYGPDAARVRARQALADRPCLELSPR